MDVTAKMIDVAQEPELDGYRSICQAGVGDVGSPAAFPDLKISVARLFA